VAYIKALQYSHMYAEVILQRRLPSSFATLTYEIPVGIKLTQGQIIEVPFGKKNLAALVLKTTNIKPKFATKSINKITETILPRKQFELAVWMSKRYKVSGNITFHFFIPKMIWKHSLINKAPKKLDIELSDKTTLTDRNISLDKLVNTFFIQKGTALILEKTKIERKKLYELINKKTPKNAQTLVLVPEQLFAEQLSVKLPTYFGTLAEGKKERVWHAANDGSLKTIVGTRAALFLPYKNLKCIVLDFSENQSYQEQRAPFYHTQEIAEELSKIYKCPLIIISSAPLVTTWYKTAKNRQIWEEIATPVQITDMENERKKGNFSLFSEELITGITNRLIKNEQTLLVMNRVGTASALFCTDCHSVFRCNRCMMPFAVHANNILRCDKCKRVEPTPESCPGCGNIQLKPLGFGTEKIESELKKRYSKAKIIRLDRDTIEGGRKKQALSFAPESLDKADIIVATQIVAKPLELKRLTLAAVLYPDQMLQFADYRVGERILRVLNSVRLLVNNGQMILQTFLPDHPLFNSFANNTPEKFYEEELKTRKSLGLPPF